MPMRTFGTGEPVASRTVLLSTLNRLRARAGRTVPASKVATRIQKRGITAQEVRDVAAANPTLVTDDGNGNLTLTGEGLIQARCRMSPRWTHR